jgi:hypothetical protein
MSGYYRWLIEYEIPPLHFEERRVDVTDKGVEIFEGHIRFGDWITTGRVYLMRRPSGWRFRRIFPAMDGESCSLSKS